MRLGTISRILAASAVSTLALAGCSSSDSQPTDAGVDSPTEVTGPLGARADLPVDEHLVIEHLSAPVDVVRDTFGRPHIYAATAADAMRAEGWLVAKDRGLELEFFRRVSEGRLAEILSQSDPSTIDVDITYRHIGLGRVAKAEYDALPAGELKDLMDAYADGVTQVFAKIRTNEFHLPNGVLGIDNTAFTDWTGADSLAIGRLQTHLLSYDADVDLENQIFFDAAHGTFSAGDADPLKAKRAGLERDLFRFAPADPATTTTGYPMGVKPASAKVSHRAAKGLPVEKHLDLRALAGKYLEARHWSRNRLNPEGFGSNNWAIAADRSATGHALVASDPHLSLIAPSIFWPVSIDVTAPEGGDKSQDLKVAGVAFPGIPGIILGHNEHIAWGATVAGYDVSDVYAETLTPDGKSVMYKGKPVAIETIDEVINRQGKAPFTYKVQVVPHHGPIQPTITGDHQVTPADPAAGAVSIRWTGLEATHEIEAVFQLLRAKDVDEARAALKSFGVGAQNWMLGDSKGNVLWTSHANVPVRDPGAFKWDAQKYEGTLPCFVLPGDGTAEWKGYLPDDLVPWEKNPSKGYISTANNDPIGNTLDNDPSNDVLPDGSPMYLASSFDIGFREGRIHTRIEGHKAPFTTEDLSSIQGDHRSAMGAALTPMLLTAIDHAEAERKAPGAHPALAAVVKDPAYQSALVLTTQSLLEAWGKDADYEASAGIDLETNKPLDGTGDSAKEVAAARATLVFNTWLTRFIGRTFGDELSAMKVRAGVEIKAKGLLHLLQSDPTTLATYDAMTGDSALWDDLTTPEVESREERMIRGLLDAFTTLEKIAGPDPLAYRWGAHHSIRFTALISIFGSLSIPPTGDKVFPDGFPRPGDQFSVDACGYGYAPLDQDPKFTYNHGPSQRFVIDLDPAGPKAWNALPGGAIWDAKSPHFRDEAELWRKNQVHPVPFALADVIAAKEKRTVAAAK
ncbi:MAG: penicillin acylase family protein [Minicystis sp.]